MTRRQELFIITAVLLIAAFFRFYRLDELPPGLHFDEAYNVTMAQRVLAGTERPIYFTEDMTEEPLAIYSVSIFFWLLGASPFTVRFVSAFVGVITVAALYALARRLFISKWSAALAALILAMLYWHVNFSRLGMEPIFLPMLLTVAVTFLWRALDPLRPPNLRSRKKRWGWFVLAGISAALTLYTYKGGLFVPIFLGAFISSEFLLRRSFIIPHWRGLAILFLTAVLAFAPLGLYFVANPQEFLGRPSSVIVAPTLYIENLSRVGAMFFLRGDENPRSNLPGRGALDPVLAVGFVAGIVSAIWRFNRPEARLPLLWLAVMILPSVFTDFAPHFGRTIAAPPALALVTASGFTTLIQKIRGRSAAVIVLLLGLAFSALATYRDYFQVWGARSGLYDSFDVGLFALGQKLRPRAPRDSIYITPLARDHYTVAFALEGARANSFDSRRALVLPPAEGRAMYGIITRDDPRALERLQKIYPGGRVLETVYDFTAQPYAVLFQPQGRAEITPEYRVAARLNDSIALLGYDLNTSASTIQLTIYWECLAPIHAEYTVFVHLIDSTGKMIAQDDAQPGHGTYPTRYWRAGQVILDDYRLIIHSAAGGKYRIEIGMYVVETGARIRVNDASGARMEHDRVLIERLTIP